MMSIINGLENLLAKGQDNALLRFGLGNAYFQEKSYAKAAEHLSQAVQQDPNYSAAWKVYGKALQESGSLKEALAVYQKGAKQAEENGDLQASKEMHVFAKRLERML